MGILSKDVSLSLLIALLYSEAKAGSGGCDANWTPGPTVPTQAPGSTMTPRPTISTPVPTAPTRGPTTPYTTIGITSPGTTREPGPVGWQRTVIFLRANTNVGNDLFFTGGIGHDERVGKSW